MTENKEKVIQSIDYANVNHAYLWAILYNVQPLPYLDGSQRPHKEPSDYLTIEMQAAHKGSFKDLYPSKANIALHSVHFLLDEALHSEYKVRAQCEL